MGQIQNAFNAGVGSIIASKAMGKHLQSQALDAVESQLNEGIKLGNDAEELANKINKNEYQRKLDMDLDKAKKSLEEVNKQQEATAAQAQAFQTRMELYNKRQGLLQDSLNKLPAKKRPELSNLNKIIPQEQLNAIDLIKKTNEENK